MTKEETLSNLKAYLNGDTAIGNIIPLRSILESAIKYLEPSPPSNLDEAAENRVTENGRFKITPLEKMRIDDIIFGAEWMAEQGETIEGEIVCAVAHPHENKVIARVYGDYKFGDKVVVQIRKK